MCSIQGSSEKQATLCVFVGQWAEEKEREICLKKLAHAIMGAGKSNFCRADQQA